VDDHALQAFHASLDRVLDHPGFIDLFYDNFFEAHPDVGGFFAHTDMRKQKRKLVASLTILTDLHDDNPGSELYVGYLGRLHAGYQIPPRMYDLWLDALIASVSACDEAFSPQLESHWREVMSHGIARIQAEA
jgi:hemoglobin-like flavoprotein